jgi:hypothetical protein
VPHQPHVPHLFLIQEKATAAGAAVDVLVAGAHDSDSRIRRDLTAHPSADPLDHLESYYCTAGVPAGAVQVAVAAGLVVCGPMELDMPSVDIVDARTAACTLMVAYS